jgi:hypothetical protein
MGIPYSREINAAFEQVTPLVAAGFKVLKTTRNISILLAVIQVLTVFLLALILCVLLLVVYSVNPDLEVRFPRSLPLTSDRPNASMNSMNGSNSSHRFCAGWRVSPRGALLRLL